MKMKFVLKQILVCLLIYSTVCIKETDKSKEASSAKVEEKNKVPEYEIPLIVKHDYPFDHSFNPRLDTLNMDSVSLYKRYKDRQIKDNLSANRIRNDDYFNMDAWLTFMENEDIVIQNRNTILDNLLSLRNLANKLARITEFQYGIIQKKLKLLQSKSNLREVIVNAIQNTLKQKGNIHSNHPLNKDFKDQNEDLILDTSNSNGNLHLGYNTLTGAANTNIRNASSYNNLLNSKSHHIDNGPESSYYPNNFVNFQGDSLTPGDENSQNHLLFKSNFDRNSYYENENDLSGRAVRHKIKHDIRKEIQNEANNNPIFINSNSQVDDSTSKINTTENIHHHKHNAIKDLEKASHKLSAIKNTLKHLKGCTKSTKIKQLIFKKIKGLKKKLFQLKKCKSNNGNNKEVVVNTLNNIKNQIHDLKSKKEATLDKIDAVKDSHAPVENSQISKKEIEKITNKIAKVEDKLVEEKNQMIEILNSDKSLKEKNKELKEPKNQIHKLTEKKEAIISKVADKHNLDKSDVKEIINNTVVNETNHSDSNKDDKLKSLEDKKSVIIQATHSMPDNHKGHLLKDLIKINKEIKEIKSNEATNNSTSNIEKEKDTIKVLDKQIKETKEVAQDLAEKFANAGSLEKKVLYKEIKELSKDVHNLKAKEKEEIAKLSDETDKSAKVIKKELGLGSVGSISTKKLLKRANKRRRRNKY